MNLSPEDSLRLNVLLAQKVQAVRINVSKNIVYAITKKGEAKIQLHPNSKDGIYQKEVKDLFLNHLVGAPKGYTEFRQRWMELGNEADNLGDLLKIAEPEALNKVIHSPLLTEQIAKLAWWCEQSSENARAMLNTKAVAQSEFGKELADFLIEFLSHEEQQQNIIDSLKSVLQPNLISPKQIEELWIKGKRKNIYYVGFLLAIPYSMPNPKTKHSEHDLLSEKAEELSSNPCFTKLQFLFSDAGQTYISTLILVLKKPATPVVVYGTLTAIRNILKDIAPDEVLRRDIKQLNVAVENSEFAQKNIQKHYQNLHNALADEHKTYINHLIYLSMVSEQLAIPILSKDRLVGSAMRKKIAPITQPIIAMLEQFI